MAKILGNKFPFGLITGKIGNIVLKNRNGKYYVSSLPQSTKPSTKKQLAHQERFRKAVEYGKTVTREGSPTREYYVQLAAKKNKSAMNLAVADWFAIPVIEEVDLSEYHGLVGDIVTIRAFKPKTMVTGVSVVILDDEGHEVERGKAVEHPLWPGVWSYTATTAVVTRNATIVVTATDLPGNTDEARLEKAF